MNEQHVHFIGIGGSGLSAIATVLLERGWRVSGSDRQSSALLQRLQTSGVQVFTLHQPENIIGADLVVRSSAVPDDHVEVLAARAAGIPVLKRADFLSRLMAGQQAIAIAGTHGKTTTTAMIAWMLTELGKDPSYVIGGEAVNLGRNAHAGAGQYFVIEADEYDRMFLGLTPHIAVVTNIEHDHPDCFPTAVEYQLAFEQFAANVKPGGVLLACADDPGAERLLQRAAENGSQSFSYSLERRDCDYLAYDLFLNNSGGYSFSAIQVNHPLAQVALRVPGRHNVANALAALAVADLLGLPAGESARALGAFAGAGRRFEIQGQPADVVIVNDYAHHPTEIRATLAAARQRYPQRRIWAIWQPHTYSRTRLLFTEFAAAFDQADFILVTEIYAAREAPPEDGFSARQIVQAIAQRGRPTQYAASLQSAGDALLEALRPGDAVLVLSAGDADQISARLMRELPSIEKRREDHV